jgi:hypothetical protein
MTWRVEIPGWHPTPLNRLLECHWAKRGRLKKADYQVLALWCRLARVPEAKGKRVVRLHVVLGKGQRACDPDSFSKVLLDGLVAARMLVNDNRQWVECPPPTFSRAKEKATVITLEEVGKDG